ncbi:MULTISPECIES: hypothetical protein [unclassified Mycobacterium]|uniref:hypothetical protein n=1 Tax=unclassified Mycobacterium TaxID=2642494 RepID=UPI00080072EB|nr:MULTISPECIES: hypothetical protein [unclassified Mycobacterium]OBH86095.1 hypothetical protein A5680_05735 [Mycobacterium sp. E2989]
MGVQSSAHFGVEGQSREDALAEMRACLEGFEKERYGVSQLRVEIGDGDSVLINLVMVSDDVVDADADAAAAAAAIIEVLRGSPHSSHWRERQRELTLA